MSLSAGQGGKGVSVLEALFYWCRSAAGEKEGYQVVSVESENKQPNSGEALEMSGILNMDCVALRATNRKRKT
jgi:hypothetical protein